MSESEQQLPQKTEELYRKLADDANGDAEALATLDEMHKADVKERENAIKDIANAPLPDIAPNGVAALPGEMEDAQKRYADGEQRDTNAGGQR